MRPRQGTPWRIGIGIAALGLATLVAPQADASDDGLPGIITFSRLDANDNFQVWVANADLTEQHQLTSGDTSSGFSTWRPDGTRLAFDSNLSDPDLTDDVGINDVFTMNPDGSDVVRVTNGLGFAGDPSWSPDGSMLAFEDDLGEGEAKQGIYLSRPDGTGLRRVTTLPAGYEADVAPRFSPDGQSLVFTRYRVNGHGESSALFVVNVDGSHERRLDLTAHLHPGDAAWSPDGKNIVFEADGPNPSRGDIYAIGANGQNLRNLTNNTRFLQGAADPVYSPDGQQIMYLKGEFPSGSSPTIGLATMDTNGQGAAWISDTPMDEHQPDWILAPRF